MANLIGLKFGRLKVKSLSHKNEKRRTNFWSCECDCGNLTVLSTSSLRRKNKSTMSCGCYRYDQIVGKPAPNRLNYGLSNLRSLMCTYRRSAKERCLEFDLSEQLFYTITKSNCHYCGSPPLQKHSKRETYGIYLYNGIDRINSNLGYSKKNCLPCCKDCNYAKRKMGYEDFLKWVEKVYEHRIKSLQRSI